MSVLRAIPYRLVAVLALLAAMALFGACAFAPVDRPVIQKGQGVQQRAVKLPPDQAFEVALQALQNMGYTIASQDQGKGLIRSGPKEVSLEDHADCGSWNGRALRGKCASILVVKVSQFDSGQSLVVAAGFFGVKFKGHNKLGMVTREETFRCASLGALENNYMRVMTNLAAQRSPKQEKQAEKAVKETEAAQPAAAAKPATEAKAQPQAAADAQKQTTAAQPAEQSDDPKLQKLKALKSMGLLSDQEFENEKAKLGLSGK